MTMSDKSLAPYTEAVLHEIQRKGNIAPLALFHQNNQPLEIENKFWIPSQTIIVPMIGEIMHDPKHFVDPLEFNPERYLTKNLTENGESSTTSLKFTPHPRVIPFGFGKRRCLGESLAKTTMYKFLTAIIQNFEIKSGQDEPITEDYSFGLAYSPKPYKLKFVRL